MEDQRELVFHDTVPLPEEELAIAMRKVITQKDIVLQIFKDYPRHIFSPYDIEVMMDNYGVKMLLTSIRRSITDLTKEGRLIKCDYSERKPGHWGTTNRTWRYNTEYIAPLNPPAWNGILAEHPNPKFGTWIPKKGNSNFSRKMENYNPINPQK